MASELGSFGDYSTDESQTSPLKGSCGCKYLRYRMVGKPLIVHCCHCRWCQRETGSAFAVNGVIEANRVVHLGPEPTLCKVASESGLGQTIARCPQCNVAIWSNYGGPLIRFVRVGTLDQPANCPPDIHIFTASKQPWMVLPDGVPALENTYESKEAVWSKASLDRFDVFKEKVRIWEEKQKKEPEGVAET